MRHKRIFKDASGRTPQAADEEKAVRLAQQRLLEAEEKLQNVKKYARVLQKEIQTYQGSVQRFLTTIQSEVPNAIATLGKWNQTLEEYVTLKPEDLAPPTAMGGGVEPNRAPVEEQNQPPESNPKSDSPTSRLRLIVFFQSRRIEPMGVYEGRGTLSKALKTLQLQWQETRMDWRDSQAVEFEKRYLVQIESDLRSAVGAMDHMAVLLSRIKQACE